MNKTILLIALGATILTVGMFGSMATQDASAARGGTPGTPWTGPGVACTGEDGPGFLWTRTDGNGKTTTECRT